ncbi:PDR/VanB family oxidoreductase [Paraburkholderia nemoris]|uniref:PDR/VanB family oxidoreductase n=1 Tax=Paraburkholderia nemoris TaxID=2793076 RepID=UPI0038BCE1A9
MASSSPDGADILVRLTEISYGAAGINIYRLSSIDGARLPEFEPGAHIDLQISSPHRRQYSLLWPAPSANSYSVAVQLDSAGRGGSRELHHESVVGNTYRISAPRNNFRVQPGAERYALFAGGIGITPIVSMYRNLKERGAAVALYYWTANPLRTLFYDELSGDADVYLMHDVSLGAPAVQIADVIRALPPDTQLYCCGPERMLNEFDAICTGRPAGVAHRERFGSTVKSTTGDEFQVMLKRSNRVLTVAPSESVLQACLKAGIDVAYSCEEGVCGACEVAVLEGKVDHRDSILTPEQRQQHKKMMICCSRARDASLVLDL